MPCRLRVSSAARRNDLSIVIAAMKEVHTKENERIINQGRIWQDVFDRPGSRSRLDIKLGGFDFGSTTS